MGVLAFFKGTFTRKAFRRTAKFSVQIIKIKVKNKKDWYQTEFSGNAVNISEKGTQVDTLAPLAVGDHVTLRFALREGSKIVEVGAIARNIRTAEGGKVTVGFEFYKPSPEVNKYLGAILQLYRG